LGHGRSLKASVGSRVAWLRHAIPYATVSRASMHAGRLVGPSVASLWRSSPSSGTGAYGRPGTPEPQGHIYREMILDLKNALSLVADAAVDRREALHFLSSALCGQSSHPAGEPPRLSFSSFSRPNHRDWIPGNRRELS